MKNTLSKLKLQWRYAKGSIQFALKWKVKAIIRCEKCKGRRWAEEIVVNHGWCDRCFSESYSAHLAKEHN